MVARGRFITLEGGEGVGKSTQLAALAEAIRARGKTVVTTREPGGSPGAEAIRSLLMQGATDRWSPRAEALLFAAARADHVERLILPALGRGDWVLCDRFIDSSRAYQGGAGGLSDDDVMTLHRIGSNALLPDRTLVLHVPAAEAEARTSLRDGATTDRFGARPADYHQTVARTFARFCERERERFAMVDALGAPDAITKRLLASLADLL
jgi:dTMP kinase